MAKAETQSSKSTAKKTTRRPAAKRPAKTAAKDLYVFFNCNEDKTVDSMNIEYNNEAFQSTKVGRAALWEKILAEKQAGRIYVEDEEPVKKAILEGKPEEASQYLRFGAIKVLNLK